MTQLHVQMILLIFACLIANAETRRLLRRGRGRGRGADLKKSKDEPAPEIRYGAPVYLDNVFGNEETRLGFDPTSRMACVGPANATKFVYRLDMLLEAYDSKTKEPTGQCLQIHSHSDMDFQECDVDEEGQHWLFTRYPSVDSANYYMIVSLEHEEVLEYNNDMEDEDNMFNLTVTDLDKTFGGKPEVLFHIGDEGFFSGAHKVETNEC